ncbi:MAG: LysO family transporter [Bacteroidales bacterium]
MRNSLYIVLFFAAGVLFGYAGWLPATVTDSAASSYALYLLMLLAGISIGADRRLFSLLSHAIFTGSPNGFRYRFITTLAS